MRAPCTLLVLLLGGGLPVSSEVPPENLAPALVGSLFGLEPEAVPVDGLSEAERNRVEAYNRCVARFSSRIPVEGLPQGPGRWLTEKRQRVERGIVCLVGGDGIDGVAAGYARDAELFYEWEGMSDGPLAEAAFAERYLRSHHDTILASYLHLFIAHRSRCAAEALAAEGNEAGQARATESFRRQVAAVREDPDPLVRLAAGSLERMPWVYLRPLEPEEPASAPGMTLRQALDRAEAWVREQAVDTSGQLLHSVSLRYDEGPARRGSYWLVQWTWLRPRLGGEVSVRVDMDGAVTARRIGP